MQVPMLLGRPEVVLIKQTWRLVKCIQYRELWAIRTIIVILFNCNKMDGVS